MQEYTVSTWNNRTPIHSTTCERLSVSLKEIPPHTVQWKPFGGETFRVSVQNENFAENSGPIIMWVGHKGLWRKLPQMVLKPQKNVNVFFPWKIFAIEYKDWSRQRQDVIGNCCHNDKYKINCRTHAHARTHTRTHVRTRTHTHTHTHTGYSNVSTVNPSIRTPWN